MNVAEKNLYRPSKEEAALAVDGGIRYVAGVSYLHNPDETWKFHHEDPDTQKGAERIVLTATRLIRAGISQVIRYANSSEVRKSLLKMSEHYDDVLPNILDIKDDLYASDRTAEFFPLIRALEPMPIRECGVYKRFCRGNFNTEKLPLKQMVDDVTIHADLEAYCMPPATEN